METAETKALQKSIEKFITKKIDLVKQAQSFAKKILDYGLLDPAKTLPFQLIPTDISDSDGDLVCKIYINLDNPIYGYFSIEMLDDRCAITCPHTYNKDFFLCTHDECNQWLDSLDSEMDDFYKLQSASTQSELPFCEMHLNKMLELYKSSTQHNLITIKDYISSEPRTAICTNGMYALVTNAKKDFARALHVPDAWVVFESLDNLPDEDESVMEYIDEIATNKLFDKINDFFKSESYFSAPLYLAQRILLQGNLNVQAFSITEDGWVSASKSDELGELVLPVIDLREFKVTG